MPRRARVLHIFKIYRPMFTGEGVFLERCSVFMQALAPEVEHDLLVTTTPQPAEPQPVCSTLSRIQYLTKRPVSNLRRELLLVWWFIRNLHRYRTVHVRVHADWYFLTYILCKLAGRRLVLSATLEDSVPVHVTRYRSCASPDCQPAVPAVRRLCLDQSETAGGNLRGRAAGKMPSGAVRHHLPGDRSQPSARNPGSARHPGGCARPDLRWRIVQAEGSDAAGPRVSGSAAASA